MYLDFLKLQGHWPPDHRGTISGSSKRSAKPRSPKEPASASMCMLWEGRLLHVTPWLFPSQADYCVLVFGPSNPGLSVHWLICRTYEHMSPSVAWILGSHPSCLGPNPVLWCSPRRVVLSGNWIPGLVVLVFWPKLCTPNCTVRGPKVVRGWLVYHLVVWFSIQVVRGLYP